MEIKAIFKEGVFQPLRKKKCFEGQIIEINIETSEKMLLQKLACKAEVLIF